jgi:hypothetical protein
VDTASAVPTSQPRWRRWLRGLGIAAVCLFVVWHLLVQVVRNALDVYGSPVRGWVEPRLAAAWARESFDALDTATQRYSYFTGVQTGWSMYAAPVARWALFLAVRLEFDDGSSADVLSPNEPDPDHFFRAGNWRRRKLEDALLDLRGRTPATHTDRAVYEAYVRHRLRAWRAAHPDDRRTVTRILLLRRDVSLALPDRPDVPPTVHLYTLGVFGPDGSAR